MAALASPTEGPHLGNVALGRNGKFGVGRRHGSAMIRRMVRTLNLVAFAPVLATACALAPKPQIEMAPPEKELASQLYGAIWGDLQSNAWIGNGNELAARWANARSDEEAAPQLHIQDLLCGGGATQLRCQFGLLRDGGVATYLGDPAPDRLACTANFRRSGPDNSWSIPRLPPGPEGGHSRITIQCKPVS